MNDDDRQDLEKQLEAQRQRVRQLETEVADLRNQLETYKPLAQSWLREHGSTKEECERELRELLAHPEQLVDLEGVLRELEQEWKDEQKGDHAA